MEKKGSNKRKIKKKTKEAAGKTLKTGEKES